MNSQKQFHSIEPVYNENSSVLILGSFPSVRSREAKFFYGHPQNRFWKLIARIYNTDTPQTTEQKKALLTANRIALWDVIASCEIKGSSDSSITDVVVNDISIILGTADIKAIFCNGARAYDLYCKHIRPAVNIEAKKLPSTSPANAACSLDRLYESWKIIKEYT